MTGEESEILINLSGGLDSVYVAYHYLKNYPDTKILFFHLELINAERRSIAEMGAVEKILEYFRKNGMNNFVYHSATFDYGTLPKVRIKDISIIAMFNSIILKQPGMRNIKELPLCWHKGEVDTVTYQRGRSIMDLTRKDMVNNLPEDLLKLISSCRQRDKEDKPCSRCTTCLEYINEGLEPL